MDKNLFAGNNMVVDRLYPQPQYSFYSELLETGQQTVDLSTITSVDILDNHFYQILNIMKDGIETDHVQNLYLYVIFTDGEKVKLSIFDYWFNLIFWLLPISTNHPIDSRYLWYYENITQNTIASYINNTFLKINRGEYSNIVINNMIDDAMHKFHFIDGFSLYLYNTANNEDTIELLKSNKEFYDCVYCDLSQAPIEDVKDLGMKYTQEGIKHILESKTHWAVPYFLAKEGINVKQYREFLFNIGTVPNDDGGVYAKSINSSFSNRGITNPIDYLIEAAKARKAQILSHQNVGTSGAFARILGLNNMDDKLFDDPNYICDSKHFVAITIKNPRVLSMYKNRYYRLKENGVEYQISSEPMNDNADLIGKTILVRSPITCASRTRGQGICHRCYGGLAKTNYDINIGKIAAEILSSLLTQRLLSAKHLLESNIKKLTWSDTFYEFFEVNFASIRLKEDKEYKKFKLCINQDSIMSDDDENDSEEAFSFNNYVTSLTVIDSKGECYTIGTSEEDNMYFGVEFDKIIKRKNPDGDGNYIIPMDDLKDKNLFFIEVVNNELSRTLEQIQSILNKNAEIRKLVTKEAVTQALVDTVIEGGLDVDAIHLEVILSHQCVSADSILLDPDWQYPEANYKMVTLNERLKDNPSITISLMYKDINKLLFYPLSFIKSKASVVDLFYMTKPQVYMSMEPEESNIVEDKEVEGPIKPFRIELDNDIVSNDTDLE